MILSGEFKGKTAKVLEWNKWDDEVTLLVNNMTCDILKCSQDDCCAIDN